MSDTEDYPIEIYEEMFLTDNYAWNTIPTLQQQDQIFDLYESCGFTHGCPGSVEAQEVRDQINAVMNSSLPNDHKYFIIKSLDIYVQNNIEYGICHPVRDEIGRNMDKTLGY